ncbi:MAG: biotin transporter BioY, partial [Microcoleus sp. SIO2G3]|nr:biotin transporter BioY [Microcoleus sp. SIO2G3]
SLTGWIQSPNFSLWQAVLTYSVYPLPAQLAIVCAVTVLAFGLRLLLFY